MKEFWNARYLGDEFAYGKDPNVFFKSELDKLVPGKILLPADGEGRNSVYAAKNKWNCFACDISEAGKDKAEVLAKGNQVNIDYKVGDFGALTYDLNSFDCIALVYAHFPPHKKIEFFKIVDKYLKVGGVLLFEGFSKSHLKFNSTNPKVGGPKNEDVLFSIEELKSVFGNYNITISEEATIDLAEGAYHIGTGSVIRFVAKKNG